MNSYLTKLFLLILCATSYLTIQSMGEITCRTIRWPDPGSTSFTVNNDYLVGVSGAEISVCFVENGGFFPVFSHSADVTTVDIADNKLIVGLSDGTIKIWDLSDGNPVRTLKAPQRNPIVWLKAVNNKIISFIHNIVRIWDFDGQCLGRIINLNHAKIVEDKIITTFAKNIVKVWDLDGHCINTFYDCADKIDAIDIAGEKLIFCSRNNTVKVINMYNGDLLCELAGHERAFTKVKVATDKIITMSEEEYLINVWDFTGACLRTFYNYHDFVTTEDRLILLGSGASVFNLHDFKRLCEDTNDAPLPLVNDNKMIVLSHKNINVVNLSDGTLLHTLPADSPTLPVQVLSPRLLQGNKIIVETWPPTDTHMGCCFKIYTDTRPGVSHCLTSKGKLAYAMALHTRCGQQSPANTLDCRHLVEKICRLVPGAWAPSSTPLKIREITDEP